MTFSWDPWGRLSSVAGTPQGTVSFSYDFAGRRTTKTVGGQTTYFLYDGDLLIAELNSAGVVQRSYWWGALGLVSDTGPIGQSTGPRFYVFNPQGSTVRLVAANGDGVGGCGYGPWGSIVDHGLAIPNTPLKWRGQEGSYTDSETGLIYMRHRFYAPSLGRFISRDPIAFEGGINLYAYPADPVNYSDPTGLDLTTAMQTAAEVVGPTTSTQLSAVVTTGTAAAAATFVELPVTAASGGLAVGIAAVVGAPAAFAGGWYIGSRIEEHFGLSRKVENWLLNNSSIVREAAKPILLSSKPHAAKYYLNDLTLCKGQQHHVLSARIMRALNLNGTLRGTFQRNDPRFVTPARNMASHNGYQTWASSIR